MQRFMVPLFVLIFVIAAAANVSAGNKYQSLRGGDVPTDSAKAVGMDWKEKDASIDRTFVHQPPLIPHDVSEFAITTSQNDCLDCHGEKGGDAPMPHASHYMDRDDKKSDTVSSRWYFCSQCHVGQVEATPLVENTFQGK